MSDTKHTAIRWREVLEQKRPSVLPFLHFYREAGLVPKRQGPPPIPGSAGAGRNPKI